MIEKVAGMNEQQRPLPLEDFDSHPYWEAARLHQLMLPFCGVCERFGFPPRARCPQCLSADLSWRELSGHGTVYTFCIMYDSFVSGFEPPYVIAQVELAEQPDLLLTTNIVECPPEAVRIGMPVELTFEELTEGYTLPQFRPVPGS